ncbi:MAG: hypothetical protein AAFU79_19880, partial [Myxococcota bacterium]
MAISAQSINRLSVDGRVFAATSPDAHSYRSIVARGPNGEAEKKAVRVADTFEVWRLPKAEEPRRHRLEHGFITAMAITPDSAVVAVGDSEGAVTLWSTESGAQLSKIEAAMQDSGDPYSKNNRNGAVTHLYFPDAASIAIGNGAGELRVCRRGGESEATSACVDLPVSDSIQVGAESELVIHPVSDSVQFGAESELVIQFCPSTKRMVVNAGGEVALWRWDELSRPQPDRWRKRPGGGAKISLEGPGRVVSATCSYDGRVVATATVDTVRLWNSETGEVLRERRFDHTKIKELQFFPVTSSVSLAVVGDDMSLAWSAQRDGFIRSMWGPPEDVSIANAKGRTRPGETTALNAFTVLDVAETKTAILAATRAGTKYVLDIDGQIISRMDHLEATSRYDRDLGLWAGGTLVSAVDSGWEWDAPDQIRLFDARTGQEKAVIPHDAVSLAVSADGQRIAIAPGAGSMTIDPKYSQPEKEAAHEEYRKRARRIVMVGLGGDSEQISVDAHRGQINSMQFVSGDGALLSASSDGSVKVWDVAGGELALEQELEHESGVWSAAAYPAHDLILTSDGAVRSWSRKLGQLERTYG